MERSSVLTQKRPYDDTPLMTESYIAPCSGMISRQKMTPWNQRITSLSTCLQSIAILTDSEPSTTIMHQSKRYSATKGVHTPRKTLLRYMDSEKSDALFCCVRGGSWNTMASGRINTFTHSVLTLSYTPLTKSLPPPVQFWAWHLITF